MKFHGANVHMAPATVISRIINNVGQIWSKNEIDRGMNPIDRSHETNQSGWSPHNQATFTNQVYHTLLDMSTKIDQASNDDGGDG